jgi:hypothetical protein
MRECVSGTGLVLWNSDEFELQVCGSPSIPIEELKKQTRFSGGDAQAAAMFWSAIGASFTNSGTHPAALHVNDIQIQTVQKMRVFAQ